MSFSNTFWSKSFITSVKVFVTILVTFLPGFFLYIPPANAYPGFSGTYTGNVSGNRTCTPPRQSRPSTASLSFTITEDNGSFTGSGSYISDNGNSGTFQMSGSISNSGTISASINVNGIHSGTSTASGTFDGTFDGTQITASIDLTEPGYPSVAGTCTFAFDGTFTKTSGANVYVNPQITPSSIVTTPQILKSQIEAITSDLQTRINDVFRAIKLARLRGSGWYPPGQIPSDHQRKKKTDKSDNEDQASLPVERTQTGFMINSLSGLNAGDQNSSMGAWASYSYTDFSNDFTALSFDGHRHGGLVGLDFIPRENILIGLAGGYENNSIDTNFNLGEQETDGYTIAPYFGYLMTDTWSLDFSFGYSNLQTDQFRTDPLTAEHITSSPDHDRWFGMINLNGLTTYGNWIFGGKLGFLYATDDQSQFIESNGAQQPGLRSKLGQINIGGEVAYSLGEFEPFARVLYENDFHQTDIGVIGGTQPSFDNDDVLLGAGLRYYGNKGLTGNLEFNTRQAREDYDEYSLTATLRYEW